jgi:hypothetical protein
MIGARRGQVSTPVGYFPIPAALQKAMEASSDMELLKDYVDKCKVFSDPFLLNELAHRGLVRPGMFYRDVAALYKEKLAAK